MIALNFGTVAGLTGPEQKALDELVRVYSLHQAGNAEKEKYYEGHVALKDVNLGIALPQGIRNLEVGCSWGQKAVDVLAARSMFDGFVSSGGDNAVLNRLIADNRLIAEYGKACRDELKYGCAFATLSADAAIGCKIRFHSPATAAALGVNEPYWAYIMENLQAQGYITGLTVVAAWGGARSISNLERCQITPDGIAYLFENNLLAKAKELLKDVKAMTPFI